MSMMMISTVKPEIRVMCFQVIVSPQKDKRKIKGVKVYRDFIEYVADVLFMYR